MRYLLRGQSSGRIWRAVVALVGVLILAGCAAGFGSPTSPTQVTAGEGPGQVTAQPSSTSSPIPLSTHTPSPTVTLIPTPSPTYAVLNLPKGPLLVPNGQGSIRMLWQWTGSAVFRLQWSAGEDAEPMQVEVPESDAEFHLYTFDFPPLPAGAWIDYRIQLEGAQFSGNFKAPPAVDATDLKWINYSDTRTDTAAHEAVAGAILDFTEANSDYRALLLHNGDFVEYGDMEESWQAEFFSPALPNVRQLYAGMPLLASVGNHEGGGHWFLRLFPIPYVKARYGSFDYGPVHISIVDQYVPYTPGSNQYAWLEQDLQATEKPWKVILMHESGWSAGGGHPNNEDARTLQPLFEQNGVGLVLTGHNHYYARSEVNGIPWLTVATGGAPLYQPNPQMPNVITAIREFGFAAFEIHGDQLQGRFIGLDGKERDAFSYSNPH